MPRPRPRRAFGTVAASLHGGKMLSSQRECAFLPKKTGLSPTGDGLFLGGRRVLARSLWHLGPSSLASLPLAFGSPAPFLPKKRDLSLGDRTSFFGKTGLSHWGKKPSSRLVPRRRCVGVCAALWAACRTAGRQDHLPRSGLWSACPSSRARG